LHSILTLCVVIATLHIDQAAPLQAFKFVLVTWPQCQLDHSWQS